MQAGLRSSPRGNVQIHPAEQEIIDEAVLSLTPSHPATARFARVWHVMTDHALARHLSDRLGFGPRPGDLDHIAKLGPDRWIEAQLHPDRLPMPRDLSARLDQLATLNMTPIEAFLRFGPPVLRGKSPEERKEIQQEARVIPTEAMEARILRAVYSPRQLEESLVDFWFNHFNVFVGKGLDRLWIGAYERDAIRPHVLGRFRDLLGATARHPAMLFYLDNWQNTAPDAPGARGPFKGLNENYARELMELHTLGVDGGYSQDDVITLARILTGWGLGGDGSRLAQLGPGQQQRRPGVGKRVTVENRFQPREQRPGGAVRSGRGGTFVFAENRHDFAEKTFLGQKIVGRGEAEGEQALDMLARHPATARHVSYKLAQYFLADEPPPAAVDAAAATFSRTNGDIPAVLKTLFARGEFRDPATFGARFKTPLRYVVSSVRATGVTVRNVRPLYGMMMQLGQPLYGCQTPDGYKCTESAWLNPDAMTRRVTYALALAAGRLPLAQIPETLPDGPPPGARPQPANDPPVDATALIATLGGISEKTRAVVAGTSPELRAALVLGSPDFMRC
jgi:uncharacterized protein (DUF1800 family)